MKSAAQVIPLLFFIFNTIAGKSDLEPEFSERIGNKTAVIGEKVELTCVIENLGSYRVAWFRIESKTILSIHTHVITRNYRITLDHRDRQQWTLIIADVREEDRGSYMCQINTVPMKNQIGYLEVVVPPQFTNMERATEMLSREGSNVTLSCQVTGHPHPIVTWQREDGQPFLLSRDQHQTSHEGEELTIPKVSRLHMGTYVCTASNSIPPSATRRIQLYVHFPPMLWVPNQLIGCSVDQSITLECLVEAFPKSLNYWTKSDGQLLVSSDNYAVTLQENAYKMHMKLTILSITKEDFGSYMCLARNSLGPTEGLIRVYEKVDPHSTSTAKTEYVQDERLPDDSLSRERSFPNHLPSAENAITQDAQPMSCSITTMSPTSVVLPLIFCTFLLI